MAGGTAHVERDFPVRSAPYGGRAPRLHVETPVAGTHPGQDLLGPVRTPCRSGGLGPEQLLDPDFLQLAGEEAAHIAHRTDASSRWNARSAVRTKNHVGERRA